MSTLVEGQTSCRRGKASTERLWWQLQTKALTVAETELWTGMFWDSSRRRFFLFFCFKNSSPGVSWQRREEGEGCHLKKIGIVFILRIGWCTENKDTERRLHYKERKVCTIFSRHLDKRCSLQSSSSWRTWAIHRFQIKRLKLTFSWYIQGTLLILQMWIWLKQFLMAFSLWVNLI